MPAPDDDADLVEVALYTYADGQAEHDAAERHAIVNEYVRPWDHLFRDYVVVWDA